MDLGSIFLILALLVLVALFVSRPFFERRAAQASPLTTSQDHEISSLLAERDRVLNALQELDFDHTLGKIPDEDYPTQRALLLQHGAQVLRRLDELQTIGEALSGKPADADAEARIEAAIAARRLGMAQAVESAVGGKGHTSPELLAQAVAPDDDLESLLASRRRARQERSAGFCPQCGQPVQKSDRFCHKCGASLASQN